MSVLTDSVLRRGVGQGWQGRREVSGVLMRNGAVAGAGRLDIVFDRPGPGWPCCRGRPREQQVVTRELGHRMVRVVQGLRQLEWTYMTGRTLADRPRAPPAHR